MWACARARLTRPAAFFLPPQQMDDLGLDDMVSGVNSTAAKAKKDKNAHPQLMQKLRDNHYSVDKVVLRDDPVAKTAEDVFRALKTNTNVEVVNLNKGACACAGSVRTHWPSSQVRGGRAGGRGGLAVALKRACRITTKALGLLAEALAVNTKLHTLIINGPTPSEGMLDVIKALETNTTVHTLTMQGGPGKFWVRRVVDRVCAAPHGLQDSAIEKAWKDRGCGNRKLLKVNIGPLRSTDVRNALQELPKNNAKTVRATVEDDEWAKLTLDYDEAGTRGWVLPCGKR